MCVKGSNSQSFLVWDQAFSNHSEIKIKCKNTQHFVMNLTKE